VQIINSYDKYILDRIDLICIYFVVYHIRNISRSCSPYIHYNHFQDYAIDDVQTGIFSITELVELSITDTDPDRYNISLFIELYSIPPTLERGIVSITVLVELSKSL